MGLFTFLLDLQNEDKILLSLLVRLFAELVKVKFRIVIVIIVGLRIVHQISLSITINIVVVGVIGASLWNSCWLVDAQRIPMRSDL